MKKVMVLLVVSLCVAGGSLQAQRHAVKTNLLSDATATFHLGWEVAVSSRWTLDLSASYNPWTFSHNKKWKHWTLQPEMRWWLCEKLNGHFLGMHIYGGQFNIGNLDTSIHFLGTDFRKLRDSRYEGWKVGGGIAYGYSWMLARHWNMELEIGIGYSYSDYDRFACERCSEKVSSGHHHYFGPTRMVVGMVYVF